MRYMFHVIFMLLIACLQGTVCKTLSIAGVSVNLFIVYISVICFLAYKTEGIVTAGAYGLMLDILTSRFIGIYMVLFVIAAFLIYNLASRVFKEPKFYISALIVFVASVFINMFYYLISFLVLKDVNFGFAFLRIILPETLMDTIISVPFYFLLKHITKRFYTDKGEFIG